jgi:hypothetical protein
MNGGCCQISRWISGSPMWPPLQGIPQPFPPRVAMNVTIKIHPNPFWSNLTDVSTNKENIPIWLVISNSKPPKISVPWTL